MLRLTRQLIPPFLTALDRQWLLNRPYLWATRIHLVLFFGLGGLFSCLVIAFMPTVMAHSLPKGWHYALALGIPALMGLGLWIWRSAQFSQAIPESWNSRFHLSLIYLLGFVVLTAGPLLTWTLIDLRVQQYGLNQDIRKDARTLAMGYQFFKDLPGVHGGSAFYGIGHRGANQIAEEFQLHSHDPKWVKETLAEFCQTAQLYVPHAFPPESLDFLNWQNRGEAPSPQMINTWVEDLEFQLTKWEQKTFEPFFPFNPNRSDFWWALFTALFLPLGGLIIGTVQMGWERSIGLIAMLAAMGLVNMLLLLAMQIIGINIGEGLPWVLLLILNTLFLFYLGTRNKNRSPFHESLKQTSLVLGLGSLYFLVLYFPALVFHVNDPPSLWYTALVCCLIMALWIGLVQPSLHKLKAHPQS